ncbi:aspartyl-phosphate phosphatase Spo0E family protein [Pseudobacillus wudalianchiensis]|uniref:Spo0E family sporulation regulatory protein-aspartic acid phosphatase n=1 Tax=Pseudobacillus wudalianchiensis TaxID=1743143 RepID=A0A1B9ANT2_9BACI|nr:aspartyl-phosphate phosphatase Spo0E family protein [Bacillus wudalianchiensis]OCA85338.1 hypothetical protein A8F95_11775 [Bacillus wudalianchiensis]
MINVKAVEELMNRIDYLRNLMILTGLRDGLNADQTLKYSEELDKLIHKYQLITASLSYKA